jgi:microcystin-dependent protein
MTGLAWWSQTAAANATVDPAALFPEGMSGAALNDGTRGMMAGAAKYRDDMAGAIVTGGTSTAYSVSSYQQFDSLVRLNGQAIAFTPHTTNGATVTLNVDSLGAKPLRAAPSVDLQSGVLIQGTPYMATYNNTDGVFYLRGVGAAPGVPLGVILDYAGVSAPSTFFALSFGQALSRTTYATLFALLGTTYGVGDGSTTFNVPDLRGMLVAGKDDMGGSARGKLTAGGSGILGTQLGANAGAETTTLVTANLPPYTPSGSVSTSISEGGAYPTANAFTTPGSNVGVGGTATGGQGLPLHSLLSAGSTFTGTPASGQNSTPFSRAMPTIIANKLLRII